LKAKPDQVDRPVLVAETANKFETNVSVRVWDASWCKWGYLEGWKWNKTNQTKEIRYMGEGAKKELKSARTTQGMLT